MFIHLSYTQKVYTIGSNILINTLGITMTTKTFSFVAATLLLTTNSFAEETLEPITIVSTNKTSQSIKNTTSNITVITAEDIEENGYQTVSEIISHISGITITNAGGLGQQSSFFVRGASSDRVLVLLDGMRLNDPSTTGGQALLENLTTYNIQQIEIIKGGLSSVWGANASAGIINIITKQASEGVHGSLSLGYGTYATKNIDMTLSYRDEKLMAQFIGSYVKTDGISAIAPRNAEKDGYENKTYNVKVGYTFDQHNTLQLSYNHIKADTEFDNSFPTPNPDDNLTSSDAKQTNLSLNYTFNLDNYSALFQASKGDYKREYSYGTFDVTTKEYSFINTLTYENGKAILGLEYKDIDDGSKGAYTDKAIFISNLYTINQTTLFETNLRYDSFDKFDNKATYKIGLKHHHDFLKGFTTSANYYTSYDAPSAYQIANPVGAKSLKPAYTKGYEISANYKDLIALSYFNTKIEDTFQYKSIFDTNGAYIGGGYENGGFEKFSGIEIDSNYSFDQLGLLLSFNFSHLITYEQEAIDTLPKRAKDTFNFSLDKYINTHTHYGISAQYIGDREEFGHSTGNYTLWNMNFSTKVMSDIDVSIHAKNIFNKEYQSVYGYATEGRAIYAKIKYHF